MWLRALSVWLLLLLVESVHGILRKLFLEPWIGDFHARQVAVFTGALLILIVTYRCVGWIGANTTAKLTAVGSLWAVLTLGFEVYIGRVVLHYSWDRVLSDFDLPGGGLLGLGLIFMAAAPAIAAGLREDLGAARKYDRMQRRQRSGISHRP